ncbi:Fatty acyl-CoA elongase/Polyunsaturated fatty acid specific elongation enzyme [Handroanthus impetiginosus]|uniref:Fatty acyl-CoA elongase/Polyunsaturated fatty acid specific elongation enzyme n=1 Tax=Handroanthus impetiginosus TaxID=429701 RepID=A0A2G9HE71_9LAMI|nr:Fatty acyl-CoA elongase/Polyunsaturated fatty acid specific elongation enzyme [Handroanthus impetiginosus]
MALRFIQDLNFFLSEHPSIINFRWSIQTWGSTWSFLIISIAAYITISAVLHIFLRLIRRQKPIPLGPIPALHSLSMALLSATIFTGILSSSIAEIRDTRWFWRRSKTPFQWLLCFPLGTRPSGRVFFWSYLFYLSRFLHIFRTFFKILKTPQKFPLFQLINHCILILMSFLWLEFSQSFQVLAILSMTLVFALVYGYRFCTEIGLQKSYKFPFVMFCQIILVIMSLAWHMGVLVLHFWKGGCNGMGAWLFNTVLNSFVLLFVLDFYVKKCLSERDCGAEGKAATSEVSYKLLSSNGS